MNGKQDKSFGIAFKNLSPVFIIKCYFNQIILISLCQMFLRKQTVRERKKTEFKFDPAYIFPVLYALDNTMKTLISSSRSFIHPFLIMTAHKIF